MKLIEYNNVVREEWSSLVQSSATGTWFQTPEAYDFFASQSDLFKPFAIAIENGDKLRGVCVGYITVEKSSFKQFLTRRAIIVGGPALADDATDEEVTTLLSTLRYHLSTGSNAPIYIETRNLTIIVDGRMLLLKLNLVISRI